MRAFTRGAGVDMCVLACLIGVNYWPHTHSALRNPHITQQGLLYVL